MNQSSFMLSIAAVMILFCNISIASESIMVFTTFYPTTFLAEEIGGKAVSVKNICPPEEDPIFWMPGRKVIQRLQNEAELIVVNGANFEQWISRVTLPYSKLVDTTAKIRPSLIRFEKTHKHSHGSTGEHTHEGVDGHTWMDPMILKLQAVEIRNAFSRIDPDNAELYMENYRALEIEILELHEKFRDFAYRFKGVLLASHPAYNYLARQYNINIKSLDLDPDTMLDDENLKEIEEALKMTSDVRCLIWESEPLESIVTLLEKRFEIESIVFSPVESLSSAKLLQGENYIKVMEENIKRLETLLPH